MARKCIIADTVVDLRREPQNIPFQDYSHQDVRETQLLYGEKCDLVEERGAWVKINALEQLCFNEIKLWHPYSGWVKKEEITEVAHFEMTSHVVFAPYTTIGNETYLYGTFLKGVNEKIGEIRALPKQLCRKTIVEEAKQFLGAPYLWGGRAFFLKNRIASVDCSGLINLIYRAQGLLLPRNAHEQYLFSKPTPVLQPGDPLFLAKEKRISHVIMKIDDKTFLESPETGKNVRLLSWGEHLWQKDEKIVFFDRPYDYTPYPATFINS